MKSWANSLATARARVKDFFAREYITIVTVGALSLPSLLLLCSRRHLVPYHLCCGKMFYDHACMMNFIT
jgi:hypothetical protein